MSLNRENVIWQSSDGTWNRGFYAWESVAPEPGEDPDPEWDVEYDTSRFNWLRTGMSSKQEAYRCWNGVNPGSSDVYHYDPDDPRRLSDRLDAVAARSQQTLNRSAWAGPRKEVASWVEREELVEELGRSRYRATSLANQAKNMTLYRSGDLRSRQQAQDRAREAAAEADGVQGRLDDFDRANPQLAREEVAWARSSAERQIARIDSDPRFATIYGTSREKHLSEIAKLDERAKWLDENAPLPRAARSRKPSPAKQPPTDPNRHPAGSGKGGQFAPKVTAEADVELTP